MTSKQVSIRMDVGLYDALTRRAREEGRSVGGQVRWEVLNSWCLRTGQVPNELGVDDSDSVGGSVDDPADEGSALK